MREALLPRGTARSVRAIKVSVPQIVRLVRPHSRGRPRSLASSSILEAFCLDASSGAPAATRASLKIRAKWNRALQPAPLRLPHQGSQGGGAIPEAGGDDRCCRGSKYPGTKRYRCSRTKKNKHSRNFRFSICLEQKAQWPELGPRLALSWPELAQAGPSRPKLAPRCPKVARCWPQQAPSWLQVGPKLAQVGL